MADLDHWTSADDDLLRSALTSLRDDVDARPLPEPAFVRARAGNRSRRKALVLGAGVAAAAVAIAAVGFGALGRDDAMNRPLPGGSVSVSPSPSPSASKTTGSGLNGTSSLTGAQLAEMLKIRSTWPVAQEWQGIFGLPEETTIGEQPAGDVGQTCGPAVLPRGATIEADLRVVGNPAQPDATLVGLQRHLTFPSQIAMREGAVALTDAITKCETPATSKMLTPAQSTWTGEPRIWSFTTETGAKGYLGLATANAELLYVEVLGDAGAAASQAQVAQLLEQATSRLETYGLTVDRSGGTPSATPSPNGNTGTPGGQSTPPVITTHGTPALSNTLFLTAQQWTGAKAAGSHKVISSMPLESGGTKAFRCDPNADGAPVGLAWMQDATTAEYIGVERIQQSNISSNGSSNSTEPAAVVRAVLKDAACRSSTDPVVTVKAGPKANTLLVTSDHPGGIGPVSEYVGVVAIPGTTRTSTIVLTNRPDASTDANATWAALTTLMETAASR